MSVVSLAVKSTSPAAGAMHVMNALTAEGDSFDGMSDMSVNKSLSQTQTNTSVVGSRREHTRRGSKRGVPFGVEGG